MPLTFLASIFEGKERGGGDGDAQGGEKNRTAAMHTHSYVYTLFTV